MFNRWRSMRRSEPKANIEEVATIVNDDQYCTIRWPHNNTFTIVNQNQILVSPESIEIYKTYDVIVDGSQRKGIVLIKGNKSECELLLQNISFQNAQPLSNVYVANPVEKRVTSDDSHKLENKDDKESEIDQDKLLRMLFKLVISHVNNSADVDDEIHKVACNGCGRSKIHGDRYKCLQCSDFNLCAQCFERRFESENHKTNHRFAHFRIAGELFGDKVTEDDTTLEKLKKFYANAIHDSITCDGCQNENLKGLRFKCDVCGNYDLCQDCSDRGVTSKNHKQTHPMVLASRRSFLQISPDDIELGEKLGSGAFGAVHKARWVSRNRTVACKIISIDNEKNAEILLKSFMKEVSAYMELSGGYILKTYGFTMGKNNDQTICMIISEFMARGSLTAVLKDKEKLSLRRKVNMARQIASGMRKIHDHHMMHRDIRPDNILVSQNYTCKIGDMGIARVTDPLKQHTQIGCQPFMPPEFHAGEYDQSLDIFTYGLTLNQLFTETSHDFRPIFKEKIVFRAQSPIFQDLINRCTAENPKFRPTAREIEATLDIYDRTFDELILKRHPSYMSLSNEDKNKIYIKFHEKLHEKLDKKIQAKFPRELSDDTEAMKGIRVVESGAESTIQLDCPVQ